MTHSDLDAVTIEAFGHTFRDIHPGNAQDIRSLETDGAVHAEFADKDPSGNFLDTFSRYRIKLLPAEIVEYVEAHLAQQEYLAASRQTGDFTAAVNAISSKKYRDRVVSYNNYGQNPHRAGIVDDNRGCIASFMGEELEDLLCGGMPERYELLSGEEADASSDEQVMQCLESLAMSARKLADRSHRRPPFLVASEYDVQDLAEVVLMSHFSDLRREEWTPQSAGGAKRIDLVIPSLGALIECKYVRDKRHSRTVADELRVDLETYHEYHGCKLVYAYVYDPGHHIYNPKQFVDDLKGLRKKRDHEFVVSVVVGS